MSWLIYRQMRKQTSFVVNCGRSVNYLDRTFLAHRIVKSENLHLDRNSYLTHAILPRLSREGCTLVVLELTHMVIK